MTKKPTKMVSKDIGLYCAWLLLDCSNRGIDFESDYAKGIRWALENVISYVADKDGEKLGLKNKKRV